MRKALNLVSLLVIVLVTFKLTMWAYHGLTETEPQLSKQEIMDADTVCMQVADTGQCMCRHRDTNDLLDVGYDECVRRVMRTRR